LKAAVCREFGKPFTVEDVKLAKPRSGEVEVEVKACAICHSDISYAEGAWGGTLPAVYGHEAAGVVSSVGKGVTSVKRGDHVVVTLIRYCGDCHYCAQGSQVMCEEVFPLDKKGPITGDDGPIDQAMRTGAFAERIVVHHSQMVKVPKSVPFESASLLACGVITGFGAVTNTAHIRPGQTMAVVGCGGVGLNAIQGGVHGGASKIVGIDIAPTKLKDAKKFGATHALNPKTDDVAAKIMQLTKGRGVDYVFVTVGAPTAFKGAFDYITKNGAVVVVGMPPTGVMSEYDPGTMAAWNQRLLGSKMGEAVISKDIPKLVRAYRKGDLKLDELVTKTYRLDQINEAIAEVKSGTVMRNVIVFD
jgi:S-(hydroxymethyl)glutathione dehydrogenase/alcohol dehydrogenase